MAIGIITAITLLVLILFIAQREIYYYDCVHLGTNAQKWLYNVYGAKYDSDKQKSQSKDEELLIQPLLKKLTSESSDLSALLGLDVAMGTGRFSFALFQHPEFTGRMIGLDISPKMLELAAEKLAPYKDRVQLLRHLAAPLPFPDNTFDIVACLEAIELTPNIDLTMNELARVLRPGGKLITSRCTKRWGHDLKYRTPDEFSLLLSRAGFEQIEIMPWWEWFDRVFACKQGQFTSVCEPTPAPADAEPNR